MNRVIRNYGEPKDIKEMLAKCKMYMERVAFEGKVEILLLKPINQNTWQCLVGNLPIKKQIGTIF